ncbi:MULTISPECIES: PAS domain-containing hybrid sensor histidine kinase/response regulator [unclassified Paraburkholderia]|uniref:PAS domain-containing hybrid sensor histidine kinase/response regulator n=1 Tax=unclassified Paraburkholderia TaxID=2615204 RepID=UPI001622D5A8|nr:MULTISPECIES: PAS domain-containing sensor histidine kinase [unclassified Paraburkholderia]MBB5406096.1 PAS domain S-box-containing protein [Paraburkholderia sp. HC6.4b]MBB5448492.1 PAS domain S-box-containing protein [Paraburkholderia sp. Kb1A]
MTQLEASSSHDYAERARVPAEAAPSAPVGIDYLSLVQAISDYAIFLLDAKGNIVSWNAGAQKLKGYAQSEIVGQHFSRFYTEEAVARGWPTYELEQAALTGRFEDEGWRVRKDGTTFWANVVITAIRNEKGAVTGFAKITRDLTAQREYLEALRQSEERFRLLVDSVKDYAIFMLDPQGFVVSWNSGAARIKGYTHDEIVGRHFSQFYVPEEAAAGKPARELAIARQIGAVEDEGWRMRKDGSTFWANVIITAVYDESRRLRGFAKVTRDLTERRRREELERSGERMREFLATLAHELRNPLAPVRNAVGTMQMETDLSPVVARARDLIDRQVTHLTRLVDDLLDIGRIMSDKVELRIARVDLAELVARAIEAARPFTDSREQRVVAHVPDAPVMIRGDMTRLVQVLQNLLHNASKFSPNGSAIEMQGRVDFRMAVLEVRDPGCGIPVRSLDKIFELFAQEKEGQSFGEGGLGIGLTLCKSLVEMHGGSIVASSEGLGLGSTFTLSLPLASAQSDTAESGTIDAAPHVQPLRILLVDDNRDSADSLAMLLELKGHEVRIAYEGEQALQISPRFSPHLALIDLAMPKMDGYATLAAMRARPEMSRTMYAAMTGFGHASDLDRTRHAGFHAHLVKPVEMAVLDALLAKADGRLSGSGGT